MKNSKGIKSGEKSATLKALRACGPVAKGSIAEVRMKCAKLGCAACRDGRGHPAWIFTYHEGGRRKLLYVRQRDIGTVREALEAAGVPMASAEETMIPSTFVTVTDENALKMLQRTLDMLDEDDDVQAVYTNLEE